MAPNQVSWLGEERWGGRRPPGLGGLALEVGLEVGLGLGLGLGLGFGLGPGFGLGLGLG